MVVIMYFNLGERYVDILLQSFITHIDYKICKYFNIVFKNMTVILYDTHNIMQIRPPEPSFMIL